MLDALPTEVLMLVMRYVVGERTLAFVQERRLHRESKTRREILAMRALSQVRLTSHRLQATACKVLPRRFATPLTAKAVRRCLERQVPFECDCVATVAWPGFTALHRSAQVCNYTDCRFLLAHGFSSHAVSRCGQT